MLVFRSVYNPYIGGICWYISWELGTKFGGPQLFPNETTKQMQDAIHARAHRPVLLAYTLRLCGVCCGIVES